MKGKVKASILVLAALAGGWVGAVNCIGYWLPWLVNSLLPSDVTLTLAERPQWHRGGVQMTSATLQVNRCPAAIAQTLNITYSHLQWQLSAEKLAIDSRCFSQWPSSQNSESTLSLAQLQAAIPKAQLTIGHFIALDLPITPGKLVVKLSKSQQNIQFDNPQIQAQLRLSDQTLAIKKLSYQALGTSTDLNIQGEVTLADSLTALPIAGELSAELSDARIMEPLELNLTFTEKQGNLKLTSRSSKIALLELPWKYQDNALVVTDGKWLWPYAPQSAQGALAIRLSDWRNLQQGPLFSARANMLSEGKGGKGNLVVSIEPSRLRWQNNTLPLQLTGVIKAHNLQIYTAIPAVFTGGIMDPKVLFKPGSLLRARGEILPDWIVDEARFPLAGVRLTGRGVSGPLQGNFKVRNNHNHFYLLHLAGQAHDFLPHTGRWDWRYWGKGKLLPLHADWDIAGRGYWQDKTIKLTELSTGFNQLRFHRIYMSRPRLVLLKPIHWSFDKARPAFSGAVKLTMSTAHFIGSSQLPPSQVNFAINGKTPSQFRWQASLHSDKIGPIRFNGRRDNAIWLGSAIWPEQSLTVIQPLIGKKTQVAVRQGTLKGSFAFSLQPSVGLQIGGHWRVKKGELWTPDNRYRDIQFSLPFRYRHGQWQFGPKAPVNLYIGEIENQTTITDVHAELQGFYPFSPSSPLRLTNVNLNLLGGRVHLSDFTLPQYLAAKLKFSNIDLSKLMALLHSSQITMSGHVNAELPFWLTKNNWKISNGWLSNAGNVTLSVDKELIDSLIKNNLAAGVALDWLRYMEIDNLHAQANVDRNGLLQLKAQVTGTSEFDHNRQRVRLNYTHQQNILTLWQSLSFANNLESWLIENIRLPKNYGNH